MKKGDKVVIIVVLLMIVLSFLFITFVNGKTNKKYAVLNVDTRIVKEISLESNADGIHEFKFANQIGYLEVRDGKIRMLEMDKKICPQKICSKTGWIEKKYEAIVCLPNKISVNIETADGAEVDEVLF